jgi:putative membrane protein
MTDQTQWQRLHPLSPVVRGGRVSIGIAIIALPSLLNGRGGRGELFQLFIVVPLVLLGFVTWLVTRWRVNGDDLQIETGVLRRRSLRFPLSQVQAIDIVRPGLARLFGLSELRLRMGGSSGGAARLAYVRAGEAEPLRSILLRLAHNGPVAAADSREAFDERVVLTVPTGRLVASILISDVGLVAELVLAGLIAAAVIAPGQTSAFVAGSGLIWIYAIVAMIWRRFNQEYRLTVAEGPDGLRLRGGLVSLTAETIRPGRVQAVRMVEPLLWRPFGWCRLQVDIAGRQRSEGEGQAERRRLRTVLPVGSRRLADELLDRILVDRPRERRPPPRRVRLKSPGRYRWLSWGETSSCVVTTTGRVRRTTCWVPLAKVQSLRWVQGPAQRRLRLASVHLDTAGRALRAVLRDRDAGEASEAVVRLADLARIARSSAVVPGTRSASGARHGT